MELKSKTTVNPSDVLQSECQGNVLSAAIERNAQGLWRYFLYRVSGDELLAEDLMQEFCLQATRGKLPEGQPDRIDAWLFGVAKNVLRRHWRTITRRRKNIPEVRADVSAALGTMLDTMPMPQDVLEKKETQEQLTLAITALPGKDQELILKHYFDGLSQIEIARQTGLSARAIEGRLYRARQALRDKLTAME